jgi:hypothetical protein
MRRALAAAALLCLALTGCGGDEEPSTSQAAEEPATSSTPSQAEESATPSPSAGEKSEDGGGDNVIEIEIEGNTIQPNGKRVEVPAGEPITLEIESDRAAELHVHSSPEQMVEVQPGESTKQLTIDRPGVVDVEEHDSGIVVVQLEVR